MKVILLPFVLFISLAGLITAAFGVINHNTFVIGGEYIVREGEIVHGNLELFFTQVKLEKDARVEGGILSVSSTVDVSGTVTGDLSAFESEVRFRPTAQVKANPKDKGIFPFIILLPELARWNISIGR